MTGVLIPQLVADIERLVTCESPSADLDAVARSADVVAALGADRLGAAPERLTVDGRSHLRWTWGSGAARVLVLGHHDTVWPLGTLRTHPFGVRDGVLRGPGSVDMKTGLVIAFHAIAQLTERDGLVLLVTGDEELGSPSSRALIESDAGGCAAAFVLEAAAGGGALKTERKGVSLYDLAVTGRAAHAGLEPEAGVNATIELAHLVLAVAGLADPELGTTVTPTIATSGRTSNTVPDDARLRVDVRARTAAEQQRVHTAITTLRPVLDGASLTVTGGPNRPPLEAASSAGLFDLAQRIAADFGLDPLAPAAVGGGSDGNFTAGIGVPTLDGLGAVGGGAHADDEHVTTAALPGRVALLAGLIAHVLSTTTTDEDAGR